MIRVRMYNVGFGDCILITVDQRAGPWRMLVDCGAHPAGASTHSVAAVVEAIIADVTIDGIAHLDVVVATHRHRDHVSGFADARWAAVAVGEVWLPWTEDPSDGRATELRLAQETAARDVTLALAAASPQPRLLQAAANELTNQAAMTTLQYGFAGTPIRRYLPASSMVLPATVHPPGLTAGIAHVLGPSHDLAVLRHMEPPVMETYRRRALGMDGTLAATPEPPFPAALALTEAQYEQRHHDLWETLPRGTRGQIINASNTGEAHVLRVIAELDNAINNTSLILTLEVGDHVLLLPGDAQWGPWQAILANTYSSNLVEQATFYKVSHHGSYNGTPKSIVEKLSHQATAAISVHPVPQWPHIPESALVDHLNERMTVLQTNKRPAPAANVIRAPDDLWIEVALD